MLANQVVFHFTDENAVGDGVSRDGFSAFFESLHGKMDGYFEKIPTAKIPEDELEIVGKIIHHGYIQYGMIPSRLSRSCFKYYLFETISDEELITSFFNFVTPLEAERIKNFTSNDTQSIMDILFEYSIFENRFHHRKCNEACFESSENGYYKTAMLLYDVYNKRNGFFLEETLSAYEKLFI